MDSCQSFNLSWWRLEVGSFSHFVGVFIFSHLLCSLHVHETFSYRSSCVSIVVSLVFGLVLFSYHFLFFVFFYFSHLFCHFAVIFMACSFCHALFLTRVSFCGVFCALNSSKSIWWPLWSYSHVDSVVFMLYSWCPNYLNRWVAQTRVCVMTFTMSSLKNFESGLVLLRVRLTPLFKVSSWFHVT